MKLCLSELATYCSLTGVKGWNFNDRRLLDIIEDNFTVGTIGQFNVKTITDMICFCEESSRSATNQCADLVVSANLEVLFPIACGSYHIL